MAHHHYLGFRGLVGEALYYVACVDDQWVALLGWAAAAWRCRARDRWIGWTRPQQWARLRYVANNARFLILPGVQIPHRASKTLALTTRRLAADWQAIHGHPVVLAETFVDPARFAGTAYRAAGWRAVGATRGFARAAPLRPPWAPQTVWVGPLTPAAPAVLAAPFLPPTLPGGALTMVDGNALNWTGPDGLRSRVRALTDPRHRRGMRHELTQAVLLALAAVVARQRSLVAIGD